MAASQSDLVVVIHMLHEVADQARFLAAVHTALKPGGGVLLVEPRVELPFEFKLR